jgi:hypothetical protein
MLFGAATFLHRRGFGSFVAVWLLAGTTAGAQQLPVTNAQATKAPGDVTVVGKQRKVCEQIVATGSIMTRTVCKTAEQWDEERERALVNLEKFRERVDAEEEVRTQNGAPPPPR